MAGALDIRRLPVTDGKKKPPKKPGKPGGKFDPAFIFKPKENPKIGTHRENPKKKKK